ncbi:hypothetical protein DFR46_1668 [Parasphingopyxis lamellibrachiae]|uniref:Sulphur transport domain-containing protein n=1 Tax=Parasphingopyxis lamellibrachiae TaxID=680125 RepID=A0A3D9FGI2_9SPHN|nr:hypothetical protein DFR46_1668 [Parasphingopyxis lamellibrachiae]
MIRLFLIALGAGTLFGAGLAVSGMADPTRVRGFLDLGGRWDPTLAFVMAGAILPMAIAWLIQRRLATPLAASQFAVPATGKLDRPLIVGSILFGIGWGIAGLCPGPAIAGLALNPSAALVFVIAMVVGMTVHRSFNRSTA